MRELPAPSLLPETTDVKQRGIGFIGLNPADGVSKGLPRYNGGNTPQTRVDPACAAAGGGGSGFTGTCSTCQPQTCQERRPCSYTGYSTGSQECKASYQTVTIILSNINIKVF